MLNVKLNFSFKFLILNQIRETKNILLIIILLSNVFKNLVFIVRLR